MSGDSKFSQRTSLNLVTEILCVVLTTIIGLVMVPYYIDQLGMAAYAVVPLANSVSSYMIIVANCFGNAINRFLVVALEKKCAEDANRTYSTSLMLMVMIAAVLLPVTAVIAYLSPYIFDVPDGSYDSVRILFLCEFWSSIFLNFGTCFNTTMMVYNKTYVVNSIRSSYLIIQIVGTVAAFMLFGPKLEYIGYSYMIGIFVYILASYIVMKKGFPDLRFDRKLSEHAHMMEIGKLAVWSALVRIGNLMFLQASLIISNILLGSEVQGGFSLVVSMVSMVGTACTAFTNIFTPFYYRFYSENDMGSLVKIALLGIKFLSLLIAMPLAYVCVFSPEIFDFWVGSEYEYLKDTVWIMFLLLTFNSVSGVIDVIPTIMLKVNQAALITGLTGALNIILSVAFVVFTDWGILGIAAGYMVSMFVRNGVVFPVFIARIVGAKWHTFFLPMVGGFVYYLIGVAYTYAISLVWDVHGTLLSVAVSFFVMFFVFAYIAMRLGLRKDERLALGQAMPSSMAKVFVKLFC